MRKLKKLLAAVLAGTMVITSLTGCGGSGSSSKGPLTIEQIKKNGKLIVATEAAYEPFEYLDKDGETIIGYNADLFKEILIIWMYRFRAFSPVLRQRNMI